MLDTIGESAVRTTTRIDNNLAVEDKDVALKKVEKAVEERPIEGSEKSAKPDTDQGKKANSYGYEVDDGEIYFEKYDKDGNVVFRAPPEKQPIDEIA